jgi:hypothetical protein
MAVQTSRGMGHKRCGKKATLWKTNMNGEKGVGGCTLAYSCKAYVGGHTRAV